MAYLIQTLEPYPGVTIVFRQDGADIKLVSTDSGRTQRLVPLSPANAHEVDQIAYALRKTAKHLENRVKPGLEKV